MVSKKSLVEIVESAIENLIMTFQKSPYLFYTESDMHCYLYGEILNKLPFKEWQCQTKYRNLSVLLHKEYPTKERYRAKTLEEKVPKGARGHFDLSIWNPEQTNDRLFRAVRADDFESEQHTFIAIELDLIEANDSLEQAVHHFKWDLLKLRSDKNEVEHGYSLIFARDWIHNKRFLELIKKEVTEECRVAVLYCEKTGDNMVVGNMVVGTLSKKPFLKYTPLFE